MEILFSLAYYLLNYVGKLFLLPVFIFYLTKQLWEFYIFESRDKTCLLPLPPGSFGLPIFGETINYIKKNINFFKEVHNKLGNVVKTHILGKPTIRVQGAANVRKIFAGEHSLVTTFWPTSVRRILGEYSISQSHGDIHRKRRKIISKAFRNEALQAYIPRIQEIIARQVSSWCGNGNQILLYEAFKNVIFQVSSIVLLGFKFEDKDIDNFAQHFHQITRNLFAFPLNLPGTALNKALRSKSILMKAVETTLKIMEENPSSDISAMNYILQENVLSSEPLATEELKSLAFDFLFNGYDTTASAAFAMAYYLGHNPEIQAKVKSELEQYDLLDFCDGNQLDMETFNRLSYIRNVIKETLRILPPVSGAYRKVLKTFELEGYQVPKGWLLGYSIRGTHEISELYENFNEFNPDRWDAIDKRTEATDKQSRYNFIPFGGGSRQCLGKEFSKLVLTVLVIEMVRRCTWAPAKSFTEINILTTPQPKDGFPVIIKCDLDLNSNSLH